jgi:hypothetical protein
MATLTRPIALLGHDGGRAERSLHGRGARGEPRRSLRGMASAGVSDEAYRRAYRECQSARGF